MKQPRLLGALVALCVVPSLGVAQTVRGSVHDADTERAIESGVITLVEPDGAFVRAVLTDSLGTFAVLAPEPGAYRLRFERLGYAPITTDRFTLQPGETITRAIVARPVTASLARIVVRDTPRCRVLREADTLTARVWTSVRTVLAATVAGEDGVYPHVTIERYERDVDSRTNTVTKDNRWTTTGASASPFVALAADVLIRDGFVQRRGDSTYFYAPEASTLIADPFLRTHCFRVNDDRRERGRVGLDIEPVPGRRVADLRGTLWLDAESGELRRLDFIYVNLPTTVPFGTASGWVEFRKLPNGAWIVDRWALRMPLLAPKQRAAAYGPPVPGQETLPSAAGYELAGSHEEGGRVVSLEPLAARGRQTTTANDVRGRVTSAEGGPVPGARVFLSGTSHAAVTDSAGQFALANVAAGTYRLSFVHPRLDTLGIVADAVQIDTRDTTSHTLRMPTDRHIAQAACTNAPGDSTTTLVYGVVIDGATPEPIPHSKVLVSWRPPAPSGSVVARRPTSLEVTAGADGLFQVCGVPSDVPVDLVPLRDGLRGRQIRVAPGDAIVRRADVSFQEPPPRSGVDRP